MSKGKEIKIGCSPTGCLYMLFQFFTAIVGYHIHNSIFWSVVDWFIAPLVWLKWFIYQEITLSVLKNAFPWFFN